MAASGTYALTSNPAIPNPSPPQSPITDEEEIDVPKPCCTRTLCGKITCGPNRCLSSAVKTITFIGAVYFGVTEMTAAAVLSGVAFGASILDDCVNRIDFSQIATDLKEQNGRLRTSVSALKSTTTQLSQQIDRVAETNREVSQELEAQKRLVAELQSIVSQLREQQTGLKEVAKNYEGRVTDFNRQLDTFKQRLQQMPALIESIQNTDHRLGESIGKVHQVLNPLLQELDQLVDTLRDSFRIVMEALQKEKQDLEASQSRLSREITQFKQDAENFQIEKRQFTLITEAYKRTDTELRELRIAIAQERHELEDGKKALDDATRNLERERAALAGIRESLNRELSVDLSTIIQREEEQEAEIQRRLKESGHDDN